MISNTNIILLGVLFITIVVIINTNKKLIIDSINDMCPKTKDIINKKVFNYGLSVIITIYLFTFLFYFFNENDIKMLIN